jgi:hypothetical protein
VSELKGIDREVLDAFRAANKQRAVTDGGSDQARVMFHDVHAGIRGSSPRTVSDALARLVQLKYISVLRVYGPGPQLRALEAEEAQAHEAAEVDVTTAEATG